ncbi:Cysteine desulfurase [Rubripirellula amarantea]|uniref:Cysteine desulfurase n=1 Tax=Rubripirellula amarantea TaxID=2527999 RepID=A0A5C5WS29_9BACT|nr:cysteine desulfurase family protein [Rubripirellula amarantea]TWT52893.1 Cysteine desulfurase [Rubripirellula amarantea]
MIYLDHHATTPCDARVVETMLPWMTEKFGNPHSDHAMGREASEAIEQALQTIADVIEAPVDSLIVTSGATESNNLAIRGACLHPRQKKRHIVSVATEHPAVLDVLEDMRRDGFRVTLVSVGADGTVDLDHIARVIDDDTAMVSVMWANNEIGTINPIELIAELCHDRGVLLHSDATQTLGRIPVNVIGSDVDLTSFSAHKAYGPKGIGILVAGNGNRRVRLRPQIVGGGQQHNLRSGTLNPAAIIGMAKAFQLCKEELAASTDRINALRAQLWNKLSQKITGLTLNGPALDSSLRLPGNLNFSVPGIEGETWLVATDDVAFSTGSACSNTKAEPSHVLRAIGLNESLARQSVRFGIGRHNTEDEISLAVDRLVMSYEEISPGR